MRRATVAAGLAAALLAVPGLAGAAGEPVSTRPVLSGTASVSSCGSLSGVTLSWTSTDNVVTKVVLGAIPSACVGGSLSLTLSGSGGTALGSAGPVPVTGTSLTLTSISGAPTATSVVGGSIAVVGP